MESIAIIGMAGRFPGADGVDAFWENLKAGRESVTHFSDAELELRVAAPEGQREIRARGVLADADRFDAAFFNVQPRDAAQTDPQQRIFLECAWEALENAGYDPERYPGLIGVWAGASLNSYLLYNLCADRDFIARLVSGYQQSGPADFLGNEKDFLATRVSYKLNLRGPSLTVQTACSTSLVAVAQACQALLGYQTDMALAGGVSISFPQRRAYAYQEGGMASADGHTRTFDADAAGTVFGSGAGVVVLKRLSDAQADGDTIVAVIRGTAVNNDGSGKVSYSAPSVGGQAEVIQSAQALAGVEPGTVTYVEAHGTATPLGDPIEVAALTRAFRAGGAQGEGFCALGSLKTNVGHLEAASGVAALIKTALMLRDGILPPSLHFSAPNPKLDLATSPFHVNTRLLPWPAGDTPRRAGVSNFGVGGTNAHAVLEEAPAAPPAAPTLRPRQLFVLSAKTGEALDAATDRLVQRFRVEPAPDADDAAWTLQVGRRAWDHRRIVVARGTGDAAGALAGRDARRVFSRNGPRERQGVAFLFPGQGSQAVNMGAGLYREEPAFHAEIDRCAEVLRPWFDLHGVLYPQEGDGARLDQTEFTQPALFAFGYALARLWTSWGVQPAAMLGHSVGEYVAACLAGVFTLEDALRLVAERARLVQAQPPGAMLAVRLPEAEVLGLLPADGLEIAAVNAPGLCVVSGSDAAVAAFEELLAVRRVAARRLRTSHAFHSAMVAPAVEPFAALVREVPLCVPTIPFVSNVTGRWITDAQATDPQYWARHLREPVRFADGVGELLRAEPGHVLLEVGPGQTLAPLARQHPAASGRTILATLQEGQEDDEGALTALGRLWLEGVGVDWHAFHAGETRLRVPLPTYPFQRERYWIEPPAVTPPQHPIIPEPVTSAVELVPPAVEPFAPPAMTTAAPRLDTIRGKIRAVLKNLSGQDLSGADPDAAFLELGFDSLFLTQVAGAFRKEVGVKITFRQLLEDFSTVNTLAAHLDAQLPPDATPVSAPIPVAPGAVPTTGGVLDRIHEQLRAMSAQLDALRGGGATPPAAPLPVLPATPLATKVESKAFGPYRPIERGAGGGFTERQQAHLDEVIARYTARTPGSKRSTQENRAHFSDPRTVSGFRQYWKEMVYPIVVNRSAGSRLWDVDGNEYVDLTMGFGTNLLGHAPAFITDALKEQLELGMEVGPQSPLAGKVARLLCEMTGADRAAFTNTGSEAVLAAVRLARTVTGRTRIATTGGFHGINDEVLVRANVVDGTRRGAPVAPGIPEHIVQDVLVADYGTAEGLELLRAHAHELAAVLVEPVQSRRPDLQPREFLHALREITAQAGCALIFDEVITGFRCHPGGAQAYFGVQADLATWGKIMGGGLPVGAITGKAEYMDALDGGAWQYGDGSFPEVGVTFFAGTYIRHPLTMAASWAVLSHLQREGGGLQRRLNERAAAMVGELNAFFAESGVPLHLENFASLFYPHFDDEIKFGSLLYFHLRARGVHIWEGRPCFLSTAHTDADVAFIVEAFKSSVRAMQAGGFLPGEPVEAVGQALGLPRIVAPAPVEAAGVVPAVDHLDGTGGAPPVTTDRPLAFSLYYFGNYPAEYHADKYRLVLESARFADQHGFAAVWLPERHFHAVGGFSPNSSLLAAALARDTQRIALRGGSVVLPLHHPVRVAEEWSVVDNLSHGRVGVSIASGWHPNDFIFAPERFERRREICLEDIGTIQKLWRGESLPMRAGTGADFEVTLFPRPVQAQLPVWLTCIHEESFVKAGEQGMGVLGYLMNQTVDEVATKIVKYREALARHGHDPAKGHVTILVHTFVGDDPDAARARARGPLREYLRSFLDNSQKRLESQNGQSVDVASEDLEYLLDKSFNDYAEGKALIGSPESCTAVVERLRAIGADEIGCFIDFGVDADAVLASLPALDRLRQRYAEPLATAPAPAERTLPLTEAQSGLWVLGQTDPEALRAYQESTTLELRGPLDTDALGRAVQATVDRHEALRALVRFDGEAQVVHPATVVNVPVIDLSDNPGCLPDALAGIEAMAFDHECGPLLRAVVVRLDTARHLLVLTFHHLFGNGPSYWVFFEELCALYEAARAGRVPTLEPAMQLSEFVRWRNDEAARTETEDERFWLDRFREGVPVLELPTDRPRPARRTHRGGRAAVTLPRELATSLRKVAAARKGSLFMLLLSAFGTLLHRLSGQEALTVGVAYEGEARSMPGGERLFANTTNVLPLPSRAREDTTFADLFAATKELVLSANDHQSHFFGRLLKKLAVHPDPARSPVFQVFFNYESGKFRRELSDGLAVELLTEGVPYRNPHDTAMFELHMNVAEKDGTLYCECDYNRDLYDEATVTRWLGHFRTLLDGIAQRPDAPIWSLPLLDADEQRRILRDWNATAVDYPAADTLTGLFEAQVRRTPDDPALLFDGATLSYRELDRRANQLANHLRKNGVARETLVALCVERSVEMVVGMLGVLKAGGAYVPLDPDYPADRLEFMLADAAAPVLLTQKHLAGRLPTHAARVLHLDTDWPAIATESDLPPADGAAADALAYVIYTSGSTGRPKGALLTHRNVVNCMRWVVDTYGFGPGERVFQKTPFSFDLSVPEFFAPLISGAAVVMARPGSHGNGDYLANVIAEQGVTFTHFVPSMLALFLEEKNLPARCRTLRWVCCNGEPLPAETVSRFYEVFGALPVQLHNLYGPTEAAVQVTAGACPREGGQTVSIGRPLPNTQIYLLDHRGQPVPVGVPGELFIGGVQVGRGYLNRPELTGQRFLPDPFSTQPGAQLYRTGDLARWLPDGRVVHLGRLDHQVKVRGFRIELGEIEAVLNRHPGVRESVVVAREDRPGDRRLVAYVVAMPEGRAGLSVQLRAAVLVSLPEYMLPAAFVLLERLPLSPNGKVDRKNLPAPDWPAREEATDAYVAPRDGLEERIAAVWKAVLGVERVGAKDNFFELGGDSLLGLRTVNRLREFLDGETLSLAAVFETPTVEGLAANLRRLHPAVVARGLGEAAPPAVDDDPGKGVPAIVAVSRDARRARRSSLVNGHST